MSKFIIDRTQQLVEERKPLQERLVEIEEELKELERLHDKAWENFGQVSLTLTVDTELDGYVKMRRKEVEEEKMSVQKRISKIQHELINLNIFLIPFWD
jgi:uncharacterized protein (DUF342 family)